MLNQTKRVRDLEVNEDLHFQRRDWALQRIGWAVMAVVVLAALLGLFGVGLLSTATIGSREASLSVEEYQRILRFEKPTTLRIRLDTTTTTGKQARVWVSRHYLQSVQIQQINPQPARVEAGATGMTYVFALQSSPRESTAVTFNLQPQKIGPLEGQLGLDGGPSLEFDQFVYP